MSDNLKNWPEIIYKPNVNYANYDREEDVSSVDSDDIAYIRIDIARAREAKLIAAFSLELIDAAWFAHKHPDAPLPELIRGGIYKKTGLKELK